MLPMLGLANTMRYGLKGFMLYKRIPIPIAGQEPKPLCASPQ